MKDSASLQLERIKQEVRRRPPPIKICDVTWVVFGGPTDHTAKAETFLKRDPFRSKPSLTGDCWGGGGFKATSFITVGLGKRGGSPRLVRLWLSCMEYHFQPLFDVQRWPLIYFSFFFPAGGKGQKSQPTARSLFHCYRIAVQSSMGFFLPRA